LFEDIFRTNFMLGTWEQVPVDGLKASQRRPMNRAAHLLSSSAGRSKRPPRDEPSHRSIRPPNNSARQDYQAIYPPSNLAWRDCRPTYPPSNPAKRGYRATQQNDSRLLGRADLVLSSHVDTMVHHRAMPGLWKRCRGLCQARC
jgi:hypothetical protein